MCRHAAAAPAEISRGPRLRRRTAALRPVRYEGRLSTPELVSAILAETCCDSSQFSATFPTLGCTCRGDEPGRSDCAWSRLARRSDGPARPLRAELLSPMGRRARRCPCLRASRHGRRAPEGARGFDGGVGCGARPPRSDTSCLRRGRAQPLRRRHQPGGGRGGAATRRPLRVVPDVGRRRTCAGVRQHRRLSNPARRDRVARQCIGIGYMLLPERFNLHLSTPRPVADEMHRFTAKLCEAIGEMQTVIAN